MENEEATNRTPEQKFLGVTPSIEDDYNSPYYAQFLNNLCNLGVVKNKTYEVFIDFNVTLRLLLPIENAEVLKVVDRSPGDYSKLQTLKLETLTRSIERVNGHYLRFSDMEITTWQTFRNTKEKPTEIDQQRHILNYSFGQFVVDEIFKKYESLVKEQQDALGALKKNSNPISS